VLVIGWGNTLRSDDGVGWHAAMELAADPRLAGCEVLARHQLTPELALDMAAASLVVLVDADVGSSPGSISVRRLTTADTEAGDVAPGEASGRGDADPGTSSHHVDASELLMLAGIVGGHVPEAVVVGVGVADLELGERLSPSVADVLPEVVDTVARLVADHRRD
jgi:hydrogenase maturation protease